MISLLTSLFVSLLVTLFLIKYGHNTIPSFRCAHKFPTPTSGGLAIVFGCIIGVLLSWEKLSFISLRIWEFYGLASILLCLTGWLDDRFDVSYRFRLLIQLVCALVVMSSGVILITTWPADLWWQKIVTIFILMSLINASNFIDGINGLLCGCTLLSLSNQFFLCPIFSPFIHIIIASSIPFFFFNFSKGKIFLGDAGSTFFGLTLGFVALMNPLLQPQDPGVAFLHKGFILSLMPMAFLWFDVGFTLLHRIIRQKKISQAHREHFFHILYDAGFSHVQITSFYMGSVIFLSALVWFCHKQVLSFTTVFSIYAILQLFLLQKVWRLRLFI